MTSTITQTKPGNRPSTGRQGFTPWRDAPSLLWLVAVVIVSLTHHFLDNSRWLMVHLVVLGALTHAAMVWSTYFTQALLKTGPDLDQSRTQRNRAYLLFVGVTCVLAGVMLEHWPVVVAGAAGVSVAIVWHGVQLARRLRVSIAARFAITVRYYVCAAAWLPVGATLGVLLARGPDDIWRGRLLVAHIAALLLGWIGLTVTGTLVTLWPTMLRTRMDDRAAQLARRALPAFLTATAVVVAGSLLGHPRVAGAGVLLWLAAALHWGRALARPARTRPPREYASLSVGCALTWGAILLGWVGITLIIGPTWADVAEAHGKITAIIAVGFAAQLLLGALSYLVPVVIGGGPAPVRAANARFNTHAVTRLVLINGGLALALAPVPTWVRVAITVLVLVALASFLPLLVLGIRDSIRIRRNPAAGPNTPLTQTRANVWSPRQLMAGLLALAVAVAVGVAVDPAGAGIGHKQHRVVAANGKTQTVRVKAVGMRFQPSSVTVAAGTRLIVELTNTDPTTTHDLTFDNGKHTKRVRPGRSATLDVGVIGESMDGWCSIVGHRQMGMTFTVQVPGSATHAANDTADQAGSNHAQHNNAAGQTDAATAVNLHAHPDPGFRAVDPRLAPAPRARVHKHTFTVTERELQVAPGVWQKRWTFNGQVPGPTLRGRVGDVFDITLVNDGSMGHSIDFHAGALAPDRPMRTIPPGARLNYRFTATRSGIWMYHCSSMPMTAHIGAGMFGAVIIDPPGLAKVDREYLLVQSELFLGANTARGTASEVNAAKALAQTPDGITFNGAAFQYDHAPLAARVGERVRIWVLAAGPNRGTSFHIVGGQFDTTYAEGRWLLRQPSGNRAGSAGAQTLGLFAAQGGFVELSFPQAGNYPFVNHQMADAERGAHGIVRVR